MKYLLHSMDAMLNKLLEWLPLLVIIGGALSAFAKWIVSLKKKIDDAQAQIKIMRKQVADIESRQLRFEDKIDIALLEVNRRIDDCKTSILDNLKVVLQAVSKA